MNFDSIEGLSEDAVNELYFDEEKMANWYGTFCKTVYADANSNCVSFFTRYADIGHCALDCANSITFTADAMKAKCAELCGGSADIALEANVHKNAHSAYQNNANNRYCHGIGYQTYCCGEVLCYQGHYHSCHEAAWNYYGKWYTNHYGYFHGRHEHPWPITWSRCQALKTR